MKEIGDFGYNNESTTIKCNISEPHVQNIHILSNFFNEKKLENILKIGTYNIWGIEKFKYSCLEKRLDHIIDIILNEDVDIWCLQEVTKTVFDTFENNNNIKKKYAFSSIKSTINWSNQEIVTLILTKIIPKKNKAYNYVLYGEQNYYATIIILDDLCIVNAHLQAGSIHSPGVKKELAGKYSLCRIKMLELIFQEINKQNTKRLIFTGDMNFDMDGNPKEWIELDVFRSYELKDVWRILKPNQSGFTEDTKNNKTRWNIKQKDKSVRYDIITYKGNDIRPKDIKLIGTKKVFEVDGNFLKEYYDKLNLTDELIIRNNKGNLDWWPSDHFGLVAELYLDYN